jgi:hypothetical protein
MKPRATILLVAVMLCLAPAAARAALSAYSQDFEGLVQADGSALANNGWLVFGNVFNPGGGYLYGYGPFPAPNGGAGFCAIANGQGGPPQGSQQLVVYNDYNNGDHANGNRIEANVYREQVIGAADVGSTYDFQFDAKLGDLVAPTEAVAFIKTLDPNAGYALSNFITFNTAALPNTWGTHMLSIAIGPNLVGHLLQIGFASTTTNYLASGVFYDNINFAPSGSTPAARTTWGRLKKLYR